MGGCCCCCASKGVEVNNSSPFYLYPRVLEEHEPLSSPSGTISTASTGLLADTNLDTSTPDTYRPPPPPMPYESNSRQPQTPLVNQESCGVKSEAEVQTTNTNSIYENNTKNALESLAEDLEDSNCKVHANIELAASKEVEDELEKSKLEKSNEPIISALVEEDVCPICLEEYDVENPKIITKCEHHFHLGCILEWMERSDTCPVCDQETIFNSHIVG